MKVLSNYGFDTNKNVYVIAEIGINHNGNIEQALRLIDSAVRSNADAVKFQTYITEKRVSADSQIFEILKNCELPFDDFKLLKDYSTDKGIHFFSTPFDDESVDFLESIEVGMYKVASFDVVNHEHLRKISKTAKPIIMSVGMSNIEEIDKAYNILTESTDSIALLHCVSAYPTLEKDANLGAIEVLKQNYDCVIGQSDHTPGIAVPLFAVAAGAQIIEKHYMIDENMKCVDAAVSINEFQMTKLISEIRQLEMIIGKGSLGIRTAEKDTKLFRRYSN
jgi:N,N'-diacetyllegionaminate synthase